jgi:2-keto-3-deoxy-L-rhamnonate aldolase RhmA
MSTRCGVFIKTCAPQIVELLGLAKLDFAILDAEHAPFDRAGLDVMMLAGRAAGLPLFVRVPDHAPATIQNALDLGAQGLIVPHVDTPEQAAAIVSRARFEAGERGFSNAARFGRYGTTTICEAVAIGDKAEIICQIESAQAVSNAAAIVGVAGVTGLLIGRADLALSMGLRSLEAQSVLKGAIQALDAAPAVRQDRSHRDGRPGEHAALAERGRRFLRAGI